MYKLITRSSIADMDRDAWNTLVGDGTPFMEWEFLEALEAAECVSGETGWLPMHLTIEREDGTLVAAAPCYVKGHSAGEFVFDHEWAHAAHRVGVRYYPKLLTAAPFSPVYGNRILTHPEEDRERLAAVLAGGARRLAEELGASSSHWLFTTPEEARLLVKEGYAERLGIQYHWHNRDYEDFDDWLAGFKSKTRRNIRRERRKLGEEDVDIAVLEGDDLTEEVMNTAYELYLTTIDKKMWGRQYLNREFFLRIGEQFRERLMLIVALRNDDVIAGSLFIHKNGELFGRYWGCFEEVNYLHFEVSYYKPVELCIERGWSRFDAGAQGRHKYDRGFDPVLTHSAHALIEPRLDAAVRDFLARERMVVKEERQHMQETAPCRRVQDGLPEGHRLGESETKD